MGVLIRVLTTEEIVGLVTAEDVVGMLTTDVVGMLTTDEVVGVFTTEEVVGRVTTEDVVGVITEEVVGLVTTEDVVGVLTIEDVVGRVTTADVVGVLTTDDVVVGRIEDTTAEVIEDCVVGLIVLEDMIIREMDCMVGGPDDITVELARGTEAEALVVVRTLLASEMVELKKREDESLEKRIKETGAPGIDEERRIDDQGAEGEAGSTEDERASDDVVTLLAWTKLAYLETTRSAELMTSLRGERKMKLGGAKDERAADNVVTLLRTLLA
ncbi:hypothetical protein C8J57DRAFT_1232809 [Mycena rebaudengoi]|nr:hypothetical protein C8J57DRAFT_1232809 [Mycena rebaudengoi]